MSNPCAYCSHMGNIDACLSVECSYHDSWYATHIRTENKNSKHLQAALDLCNYECKRAMDMLAEEKKKNERLREILAKVAEHVKTHHAQDDYMLLEIKRVLAGEEADGEGYKGDK